MLVRIHHDGRVYVIEAPASARVVQTSGEDASCIGGAGARSIF